MENDGLRNNQHVQAEALLPRSPASCASVARSFRHSASRGWKVLLACGARVARATPPLTTLWFSGEIHEHACVRCPLLRPDPHQRPRLIEIGRNLQDRIAEAQRNRWLGEIEGLKVSLAAAGAKLAQLDGLVARRQAAAEAGAAGFAEVAGRSVSAGPSFAQPLKEHS